MTDHDGQAAAEEQLERIARLRQRQPASTQPASTRRRRHAARDSRIVAAGLGAGAMFGIITLLGLDYSATQSDTADAAEPLTPLASTVPAGAVAQPVVAPSVKVVIHRVDPTADTSKDRTSNRAAKRSKKHQAATRPEVQTGPIELTANPVVRTVTVAAPATSSASTATAAAPAPQPAPPATTSGSS